MGMERIISVDAIRSLCRSLITTEQKRLVREGRLSMAHAAVLQNPRLTAAEFDALEVTEEAFGFDSLSVQDLILVFNRFLGLHQTGIEDYLYVERRLGDWVRLIAQHLDVMGDDQSFTFLTSGSTGSPKEVTHTASAFLNEARALKDIVFCELPDGARCITMVPPHHIYGFIFSCVMPTVLDCAVINCYDAPGSVFRHAQVGDYIVGTPWNWQLLNRSERFFPDHVRGVVSAGPTDAATWQVVERCNLETLTEIFGATETGGVGWRQTIKEPFQLLPHLERDGDGVCRSAGRQTALDIQDNLDWTAEHTFHVKGRRDDVVQVGGVNVSPRLVRDTIVSLDGVQAAAVRLGTDRLKAFVVLTSTEAVDLQDMELAIKGALRLKFPAVAIPQSIRFGAALPRNAMGKLCDWGDAPCA